MSRPAVDLSVPLPHCLDTEQALLGTILIDTQRLDDVRDLAPAHFLRRGHSILFDAMQRLRAEQRPVDPFSIKAVVTPAEFEEIGGLFYLNSLTDGRARGAHVAAYADIIREKAAARGAVELMLAHATKILENPSVISNGLPARHRAEFDRVMAIAATPVAAGLDPDGLADATDVAVEGREIDAQGIRYALDGIVPDYGGVGMCVAYSKVGKTTWAQAFGAACAMHRPFLDRTTSGVRVLNICAEDPPEYVAWMARHLDVDPGRMTFYRKPVILDTPGLAKIAQTARQDGYGLVLISSWQAVVRGLVKDENDNAGTVRVVEDVKAAARASGIPWLIDAHSGKGEDQDDDADPSRAMRGASSASGSADYTLHLRYGNGAFGTQRKLSGKGRFVSFPPILMDFDVSTSTYTVISTTKNVAAETTWRLIQETGALGVEPKTIAQIADSIGYVATTGKPTGTHRRQIIAALSGRTDVGIVQDVLRGQKVTRYRRLEGSESR